MRSNTSLSSTSNIIQSAPLSSRITVLFTVAFIAVTALLALHLSAAPGTITARGHDEELRDNIIIGDNANSRSPGFNASSDLDFAVVGFPKTGEQYAFFMRVTSRIVFKAPWCK
jgi:hypothetical protein